MDIIPFGQDGYGVKTIVFVTQIPLWPGSEHKMIVARSRWPVGL
jgi:hypothetical protein